MTLEKPEANQSRPTKPDSDTPTIKRRRYTLEELLEGMEPRSATHAEREWMDAPPVGNEVI